jgi:hypothetical protein
LFIAGELSATFANAALFDVDALSALLLRAAASASAPSGRDDSGGATAVRAAALTALSRLLDGAGPRAGSKCLQVVLKHLTGSAAVDRAHTVRLAVGPAIQARPGE